MPSNKRKHQGFPLPSSNGDLAIASFVDNKQDLSPSGEISHRKHVANGKENLTVMETLPLARTSSTGVPAENSCHGETLPRTPGNGVPAENSCLGETLNATEKSLNVNGKSAYHAGYGGIQNGEAISCTGRRAHGNHKNLFSSPDCAHSELLHSPDEDAEAISNLKQLNKQLVQQVCSLRSRDSLLHDQLKALQVQLEENTARGDDLLAEKAWLEDQKVKFELDLKASSGQAARLGIEKAGLLEENESLLANNHGLERDLSECKEKVRQTGEKLKDSMKALALAEEKVQVLEAEIQVLQLDQQKLNGEISVLQMQKSEVQCAIKERESLDKELRSTQDMCAIMERQVAEGNQVKEALEAKLASRSLQREGFQMQLKGAWQQIQSLESQQEASVAEKFDLKKQIQQLVNELTCARSEYEETLCMLESERQEKVSLAGLLDNAEKNCNGLKVELEAMSSSMKKLQIRANNSQQQIISLETQVASLVKEKAVLEEIKASLKEELEHLKSSSEEASVSSKNEICLLKEDVRKLEEALASVKTRALNEDKCASDLNAEVKELCTSLKKKRGLAEVSIPLAAVSIGSLVIIGTMYLWKRVESLTV